MQRLSSFFKCHPAPRRPYSFRNRLIHHRYLTQQPPDVQQITPNLLDLRVPSSPAAAVAAIQNFIAFIPLPQVKFVQFFNCTTLDAKQMSGVESVPVPLHGLGYPCFDDAKVDFGYSLSMAHVVCNWIQVNPVANMAIILSSSDSLASTAVFVAAVLLLRGEHPTAQACLDHFSALRRSSNGVDMLLESGNPLVIPGWRAVHARFIDILNVCALQRTVPNLLPLRLLSLTLHGAPAFAASGSGWNPYIAISSINVLLPFSRPLFYLLSEILCSKGRNLLSGHQLLQTLLLPPSMLKRTQFIVRNPPAALQFSPLHTSAALISR